MNRLSNAALAAIAVACLSQIATPVAAQETEQVHGRVRYGDLDLATAEGRARFAARVRIASIHACPHDSRQLVETQAVLQCRREVQEDGRQQLTALVVRHDVELARTDATKIAAK